MVNFFHSWLNMQNRNKMCSCSLHRNDKIRSDEARPKAGFSATFCMFTIVVLIFYQCKINVCDFGGKLIRLEAAVQIKPKLFKGKQTNAIWYFGWMCSLCVPLSLMPTASCTYDCRPMYTHRKVIIYKQLFCLQLFLIHSTSDFYPLSQQQKQHMCSNCMSVSSLSARFVQLWADKTARFQIIF